MSYAIDKRIEATYLIIELASAYIRSGSHVPLSGPVHNSFWCYFRENLVTMDYDFSLTFSPLLPD